MKKGDILIYGKHAVSEAVRYRPEIIREVLFKEHFADENLKKRLAAAHISHSFLKGKQLPRGIDPEAVHQGVMAVISEKELTIPYRTFISELNSTIDMALLVLGEVQDPHNVGAVIRSAAAFGISGILIPPHKQAQITGSVIKVSAGSAFRVPLVNIPNVNTVLRDLKEKGFWTYGLAGDGETPLSSETFEKPSVFVLGNEGEGLRKMTREECDQLLSIPMSQKCESLNASVSTAVVLYEWAKQHPDALK